MASTIDAKALKGLLDLIHTSGQKILASLEKASPTDAVPPQEIYDASQILLGAAGMVSEVVQDPGMRCLQMCGSVSNYSIIFDKSLLIQSFPSSSKLEPYILQYELESLSF